jgi:transposase
MRGGHGDQLKRAPLGQKARHDEAQAALDVGAARQALPQRRSHGQERRQRRGRDLRGSLAPDDAPRAGESVEQQSMLCVHRLREGLKADRTACIHRIRGLLAEFGLVFAQGPEGLSSALPDVLEDGANEMNTLARRVIEHAREQWLELGTHLAWCDARIAQHAKDNAEVRRAAQLMGIGLITASAAIATVDDFAQFRNGAQFGAWCGITPRQDSSGGKTKLGRITRRGDTNLRSLLVQGAKSAVMTAHKRSDPISRWTLALRERSGWQIAAVALANKNARILWAVMTKGDKFDANYMSVKPGAAAAAAPGGGMTRTHQSDLPPRRQSNRRCTDRSDRRRASSTNPW